MLHIEICCMLFETFYYMIILYPTTPQIETVHAEHTHTHTHTHTQHNTHNTLYSTLPVPIVQQQQQIIIAVFLFDI